MNEEILNSLKDECACVDRAIEEGGLTVFVSALNNVKAMLDRTSISTSSDGIRTAALALHSVSGQVSKHQLREKYETELSNDLHQELRVTMRSAIAYVTLRETSVVEMFEKLENPKNGIIKRLIEFKNDDQRQIKCLPMLVKCCHCLKLISVDIEECESKLNYTTGKFDKYMNEMHEFYGYFLTQSMSNPISDIFDDKYRIQALQIQFQNYQKLLNDDIETLKENNFALNFI